MQIPLGQVADFRISQGPPMISSENAQQNLRVFVSINRGRRDLGGYVAEAKRVVAEQVKLPAGYTVVWSGQFEYWRKWCRG